MILLNGTDMEKISRIENSLKNERFLERVFTRNEIDLYKKRHNDTAVITANFCAKEAFLKAIGTGLRNISLKDIEVLRDALGKPYYKFYGRAEVFIKNGGFKATLSITHTDELAMAFVVLYKNNDEE